MSDRTVLQRIKEYIDFKGITNKSFEQSIGFSNGAFAAQLKNNRTIGVDKLEKILTVYNELSPSWILKGEGEMLISENINSSSNLIPFYEDVESFGGTEYGAELEPTAHNGKMINAGDWFHGVTAAIRHFGDSMDEYPSGCVLALKELNNMFDFVPGQNYVVETEDLRVTKRLQLADDDKYIMAYSSNTETYPDGRQRHEPFRIRKETIRKIFLVLGRVVNEHSSAPIFAK